MAEKFFSSRLINYVEPVNVGGFIKTAFYTEINTNLKAGDRVFIQNGNYDSDEFIDKDRYAKYVDGYRVISIDRCRIVLDIDYIALKPFQEDSIDNFIKVWPVRDERELRYFDSITIDSYSDRRYSKFHHKQTNNILFSAKAYTGIQRSDATVFSLITTNGFWAKESNGSYQFINYDVINNTFGMTSGGYFNNGYYVNGFTNNGRLFIYGEDFEFNGKVFKQRNIYKYQDNEWIIDTKYKPAIISKLNFRDGRFKGTHFDGVWGTYQKSLNWSGTFSNWQSGVFVNSNWYSGNLNSKSGITDQSFYATFNNIGVPIQTSDFSNNKGQGYNYILDSNVYRGTISDGNFINCNIGSTISSTVSTIDDYYNNIDSYKLVAKGGFYNFCDIFDSKIDDATILDSRVYNSSLSKTRLLNSQFYDVVASGDFDVENGIKVLSADIYSYIPGLVPGNPESDQTKIRGVLKLYIPESDLLRLDTFDNFYITKINKNLILSSLSSDQKIILPYETKYILDSFYNSDFSNLPLQVTIKMSSENKFKPYVTTFNSNYFNTYQPNGVTYSSLDLDLGEILAHYYQGVAGGGLTASNPTFIRPETERVINHLNVNGLFSNTVLANADFVSGILQNVNWNSGAMINRQSNIINSLPNSRPAITVDTVDNTLTIQLPSVVSYLDNTLRIGKNIWLDSIYHESGQNLSGRYKVVNISDTGGVKYLTVEPQDFLVNSLASDVFYFDDQINPNFLSINQAFIKDSKILSGLFKRSLITNTIFYNESFNNQDRDISISNVERLRITKTVFKNNLNDVRSGLFYRNHFFGGTWSSGLAYEVIWKGPTFSSGTFKSGYWRAGTFNGGKFVDSLGTSSVTLPFSSPNEIQSWRNGNFNGGEFDNSVWRDGTFSNGKFFNSDWFAGTWQNGILGDSNIPIDKTTMATKVPNYDLSSSNKTDWFDGVVENATLGGDGAIYWYGGKFNRGLFTSNGTGQIIGSFSRESIWYNGEFNGGEFGKLARWKNGIFNSGYFNSYYGWTLSNSSNLNEYSWENGEFNGGKFGNAGYATNSTWFNGLFNDGIFQGRVWNNGIFNKGAFNGGSTWSSRTNESNFVNSFTNSFYGLWKNGIVIDVKTNVPSNEKFFSPAKRVNEIVRQSVDVTVKNALWLDGTFSSNSGIFENSIWLGGSFASGKFRNSVFNPFVNRSPFNLSTSTQSSFNKSTSTVWLNGDFESGNFYYSEWKNGTFQNGTMSGAIWRNGTWNYGDANNILWENGRWRNGNWDGTPFIPKTFQLQGSFYAFEFPVPGQLRFYSSVDFSIGQKIRITQTGNGISVGQVVSTSPISALFAVTISVLSGSPNLSVFTKLEVIDGFADYEREIVTRLAEVSNSKNLHLINAFTPIQEGPQLLSVYTDSFGNSIPLDFWTTFTFSNLVSTNNAKYIRFKEAVKAATTGSISLIGAPITIDGVVCNIGDRVLVKNQNTSTTGSPANGVYIVQSGSWTRADDANSVTELNSNSIPPITYHQGFQVLQGTLNGGYAFLQNNFLYRTLSSTTYSIVNNTISVNDDPNLLNDVPIRFTNIGGIDNISTTQLYYIKNISGTTTKTFNISQDITSGTIVDLTGVNGSQLTFTVLKETLDTQALDFETDGATIWTNPQACFVVGTQTYCNPVRVTMRPRDTNNFQPDYGFRSKPLIVSRAGTASIFTETVGLGGYYYGEVRFLVTNTIAFNNSIILRLYYGATNGPNWTSNLNEQTITLNSSSSQFVTMTFSYSPDQNQLNAVQSDRMQYFSESGYNQMIGKMMYIEVVKSSSSANYNFTVDVISVSVKKFSSKYDTTYNNKLYNAWGTFSVSQKPPLLPQTIFTQSVSDTGALISVKYGNGQFLSGIWENGIWNNGFRVDNTLMRCLLNSNYFNLSESIADTTTIGSKLVAIQNSVVGIDYIKMTDLTYIVSLSVIDQIKSTYKVGDKVSVSNLVALDQNNNRTIISGLSTITSIDQSTNVIVISCNVPVNTIRVEVDSQEHVILMTKNIWLSGAFLNGHFNGVWNYGLFQGFPYITNMSDSHWIDGIFDGGTFRGRTSTFTYSSGGSIKTQVYSVPLVQNFEYFDDNNTANPVRYIDSKGNVAFSNVANYLSWIDVNYYTYSKTNIGQESLVFDTTIEEDNYQINLNGYPTNDILSSRSNFKNLTSNNSLVYNLGTKFKTYQSFIPNSDLTVQFSEPISNSSQILPLSGGTLASRLLVNFTKFGWTYSSSTGSRLPSISSNINGENREILRVVLPNVNSFINFNNTSINIESQRYSMIEFAIDSFSGPLTYSATAFNGNVVSYPSIYLRNDPRSDSPGTPYHNAINRDIVNHLDTTQDIKREYFYNRNNLSMYMYGRVSVSFRKIAFKEIDMVPFFQYATQSQIDDDVKTPYRAVAPFIDYTNNNFNFIGNISINIDSVGNYSIPYQSGLLTDFGSSPGLGSGQIFASDVRLKKIISKLSVSRSGINIYEFEYNSEPGQRYVGVMAQELLATKFSNAVVEKNQTLYVDYSKIDVEFKKIV